jgi:hypothetical protein
LARGLASGVSEGVSITGGLSGDGTDFAETQELARLNQRSGAKDENDTIPLNFRVWQIRLSAITSRPLVLGCSHELSPFVNKEDKAPLPR